MTTQPQTPRSSFRALTGTTGLRAEQVGKISVNEFSTYVAVERKLAGRVQARETPRERIGITMAGRPCCESRRFCSLKQHGWTGLP
jgi:hypothetical protein